MVDEVIVPSPGAPVSTPADQWYTGADAETVGFLQNRGWDKVDAKTAAMNAVKSYREASAHIGAPPDQLLRMPKDSNDKEGWSKVYSKLGVPEKAEGYSFDGVKFSDGSDMDQDTVNYVRQIAHENHLTPDAAQAVARAVVTMAEKAEGSEADAYKAALDSEKLTLRQNWGSNAAANLVVAQQAAGKLGVTQQDLAALEKVVGYSRVMEMFRQVGSRMGEPNFVGGDMTNRQGVMTQQQAAAALEAMENDSAFTAKLFNGDMEARTRFDNLTRIKTGFIG